MLYRCRMCGLQKRSSEFCNHSGCLDGIDTGRCKKCKSEYEKNRRLTKPNKRQDILNRTKTRAKSRGIPFNLTIEDIVIPPVCPVFGTPFEMGNHKTTASIDRVIPALGYVSGNIRIISNRANMIKGDADAFEIRAVADWLASLA